MAAVLCGLNPGTTMLDLMDETEADAGVRTLVNLPTPALVLDRDKMDRNVARLAGLMAGFGVTLRPHLKTAKSIDAARRIHPDGPGPITVSTLAEAEYFAREGGYVDITYAVGLDPTKAARAVALCLAGVDLKVVLDTPEQAVALGETLVQSRIARGEDYSQHIYDDSEGDGRGRQDDGAD